MRHFAEHYAGKTGTAFHPDPEVTEAVLRGLARHRAELGRPLCPCRSTRTSGRRPGVGPGCAPATT